jgi:hypothetical protein
VLLNRAIGCDAMNDNLPTAGALIDLDLARADADRVINILSVDRSMKLAVAWSEVMNLTNISAGIHVT